jgi:hypothetical protein
MPFVCRSYAVRMPFVMVCVTIVFLMATAVYSSWKTYLFNNSVFGGYKVWCAGMGVELE